METNLIYGVDMKKLYICHTVYHLYITMLKSYGHEGVNDVFLVDTISNVDKLSKQVAATGIFNSVFTLKREEYFGKKFHEYLKNHINCKLRFHKIKDKLDFLYLYSEIYIFNDYTEMGAFLNRAKISYHLLEDGLDVFKQFDVYRDIGKAYHLKKFLYAVFKIPYSVGMTALCLDIEVNSNKNLKSNMKRPIIVKERERMEENIDESYRNKIFDAFGVRQLELLKKRVLILTQVLKEILIVKNDVEQLRFYEQVISQYAQHYAIYLKPHPRDAIDYTSFEKKFNAVILEKEIPLEVYAYLPNMRFDYVITYSSTAANITNIGDKIIRLDKRLIN